MHRRTSARSPDRHARVLPRDWLEPLSLFESWIHPQRQMSVASFTWTNHPWLHSWPPSSITDINTRVYVISLRGSAMFIVLADQSCVTPVHQIALWSRARSDSGLATIDWPPLSFYTIFYRVTRWLLVKCEACIRMKKKKKYFEKLLALYRIVKLLLFVSFYEDARILILFSNNF